MKKLFNLFMLLTLALSLPAAGQTTTVTTKSTTVDKVNRSVQVDSVTVTITNNITTIKPVIVPADTNAILALKCSNSNPGTTTTRTDRKVIYVDKLNILILQHILGHATAVLHVCVCCCPFV